VNGCERRIQSMRVALNLEFNNSVGLVLCVARKVVLYRVLHDHGPETNVLIVAGYGGQHGFFLLHRALRVICLRGLIKRP
jgi:hypothetical protein